MMKSRKNKCMRLAIESALFRETFGKRFGNALASILQLVEAQMPERRQGLETGTIHLYL